MVDPNTLAHVGVKGMKWGVRKDSGHVGQNATHKKIGKLDQKFERGINNKQYFAVYNAMASRMNSHEIDRINNIPKFRDSEPLNNPKLKAAYLKEYSDTATRILNEQSKKLIGSNASGTREVHFDYDASMDSLPRVSIVDVNTQHDSTSSFTIELEISKGLITKMTFVDNTLAHVGVKGMKWGVRKRRTINPSQDHMDVSALRKKHVSEMSNADIKKINSRLELQRKYSELSPKPHKKAKNILAATVATATLGVTAYNIVNGPAGKASISLGKKILTGIVTRA